MSISKFQEKFFKQGCGTAVLLVCAGVMFGGMFYQCALGGNLQGGDHSENRLPALTVAETPIFADDLTTAIEGARQRQLQQMMERAPELATARDPLPVSTEAGIAGGVVDELVKSYSTLAVAHKDGVQFTDKSVLAEMDKQFDMEIMMEPFRLSQSGQLKPGATQKDFEDYLKKNTGKTIAQLKKEQEASWTKDFKDEKKRTSLELQVAKELVMATLQARINPTLAQLKASYDSYTYKRILFIAHPGSSVDSQIAKAQADLKSGATFETAIDRYSGEPPMRGKKLSESTIDLGVSQMDQPEYKGLTGLKVGQVSDVIDTPSGKAIYKLISIKNTAPKDLEKDKAKYIQSYTYPKAEAELNAELKTFQQTGPIKWELPGFKALYDWYEANRDPSATPQAKSAQMTKIAEEAKQAAGAGKSDDRPALLAWYEALDSLWTAPGADKAKLRPDRIDMLQAFTNSYSFFDAKLELVDLYIDAKQGDLAVAALQAAASSNVSYNMEGQKDFQDVAARLLKLQSAGLIKPAQQSEIEKIQQDWMKQNQQAKADEAKQRKEAEEARKQQAIDEAKQRAEAAKEKAALDKAQGKTPPPPAGPGSTPKVTMPPIKATIVPPKSTSTGAPPPTGPATGHKQ